MFFNRDSLKALSLLTQLGITMIVPIGMGVLLGVFLDRKLGTAPIFLFVMILIGIAAGFRNVHHITQSFIKSPSENALKREAILRAMPKQDSKTRKEESEDDGDS